MLCDRKWVMRVTRSFKIHCNQTFIHSVYVIDAQYKIRELVNIGSQP